MKPIVILTALEVERAAVEKHLTNIDTVYHPATGTDYKKGSFQTKDGSLIEIMVGRTDQTNVNAALETERAIEHFQPEYIFFVGVAGGLKDVRVGDVVIGTNVIGYERGKAEKANFKTRAQFGASTYALERLASNYATSAEWKTISIPLVEPEFSEKISVFTGTIASGEKVDASYETDLHQHIKQIASHALAIEMEGLGFLEVCRTHPAVKSLLLRGISDLVDDKENMDGKGSQFYASQNVSEFLFGVLGSINFSAQVEDNPKNQMIEIMCKLYPTGLKDSSIWVNAGGDLSLVQLSNTGKGQWIEAIRILFQGGGGKITPKSLMEAVLEDFSNNKDVAALYSRL
jgi:adenosylhomocysteine nucleosidase